MTRDDRLVQTYRTGAYTLAEVGRQYGISRERAGNILRSRGVAILNANRLRKLAVPHSIRSKAFIGDASAMTSEQLAYGVKHRYERSRCKHVYVFVEAGRVYAAAKNTEVVQDLIREAPALFVGVYGRGMDVSQIAADLETVRRGG